MASKKKSNGKGKSVVKGKSPKEASRKPAPKKQAPAKIVAKKATAKKAARPTARKPAAASMGGKTGPRMTRKGFLKSAGIGAAALGAAATGLGRVAHAAPVNGVWTLHPSNLQDPFERVYVNATKIQDAVDNADDGDMILLKAHDEDGDPQEWYLSAGMPSGYLGSYNDPTGYDIFGELFYFLINLNEGLPPEVPPFYIPLHIAGSYEETIYVLPGANEWKKLTIKGEKDAKGKHLTKIIGGYATLNVGAAKGTMSRWGAPSFIADVLFEGTPGNGVRYGNLDLELDVCIEDLEFVNPLMGAIDCSSCTGLKIKGNKFTGCRGFPYVFIPYHDHVAYPIRIGCPATFQQTEPGGVVIDPSIVTGEIIIEGNEWDGKAMAYCDEGANPWASMFVEGWDWYDVPPPGGELPGLYPLIAPCYHVGADFADRIMYLRANVAILKNTAIDTIAGFSIESNFSTAEGEYGNNIVKGNYVKHKPVGAYPGDTNASGGVWVVDGNWTRFGGGGQYPGTCDPAGYRFGTSKTLIEDNELINSGGISWYPELAMEGLDNAIMRGNRIALSNYQIMAIGIHGCNGCVIQGNRLTGEAATGFQIGFVAGGNPSYVYDITLKDSENNVFLGNNLSKLSILEGDYFIPDPAFDIPELRYSYHFSGAGEADLSGLDTPPGHGIMTEGSNLNAVRGNSKDKVADLTGTNFVTGTEPMAGAPNQASAVSKNAAAYLGHGHIGNALKFFDKNKGSLLAKAKRAIQEHKK